MRSVHKNPRAKATSAKKSRAVGFRSENRSLSEWSVKRKNLKNFDALEKIDTAFATNDLVRVCRAIDQTIVRFSSVTEVANAAQIDRTTLYRAFRITKGPALGTVIRVLEVLGFRLVVNVKNGTQHVAIAKQRARVISKALKCENPVMLYEAFAAITRQQENVTAFAKKVAISREAAYRLFSGAKSPRLKTLIAYLDALGLRFSVSRITHAKKVSLRISER